MLQSKVRSNSTKRVGKLTADFAYALSYNRSLDEVDRSRNTIVHKLGFHKRTTVHQMGTLFPCFITL